MLLQRLNKKGLIHPPNFLVDNTHYLCLMGSRAYGCSEDESDNDIYGWCIPKKEDLFPHLKGEIPGFGRQKQNFESWQEHHIEDKEARKQYDLQIFSIIKYFQLCMENNPNLIDSLFVHNNFVIHSTRISQLVRENRKMFLHKGAWFKFKGYSFSQMHKIRIKQAEGFKEIELFMQQMKLDRKYNLAEIEQELQIRGLV